MYSHLKSVIHSTEIGVSRGDGWFLYFVPAALLARDAFVRTNCRAIAMMFVRLSVRLGRACIVSYGAR